MTAPPREPQNLYDALSTIYDWLCDDRLTQWPYMENGPFYSDLPKYQEVARAALAAAPAPSAEPPATDAPCSSCGQTAGFHTLRCRDKNAASELRATHCSNEGLHDSAADLIERQAREMAELQRKLTNEENYYEDMKIRAERAESALADKARILERCRFVLGNMAQENVGAIFNRWPISHEPLRNDARGLLPDIDAVLGDSNG